MTSDYAEFLAAKMALAGSSGFEVEDAEIHPLLLPHQRAVVRWAVAGGRRALFESFGLGKTLQQLEIVRLVRERAGGRGVIVLPLGVRHEFTRDAALIGTAVRFVRRSEECTDPEGIYLTNYESVRDGKLDPSLFSVVSLDECFAPGTLVDTVNSDGEVIQKGVENIREKDLVISAAGVDTVAAVRRREVPFAVKITIRGTDLVASPNHPFFTQRGWVGAQNLRAGDYALETGAAVSLVRTGLCTEVPGTKGAAVLRDLLLRELADEPTGDSRLGRREAAPTKTQAGLRMVRGDFRGRSRGDLQTLLHAPLFGFLENDPTGDPREGAFTGSGSEARQDTRGLVCGGVGGSRSAKGTPADDGTGDDTRNPRKDLGGIEEHRAPTEGPRWEWTGTDRAAEALAGGPGRSLGGRASDLAGQAHCGVPHVLPGGSCRSAPEDSHRGRWSLPPWEAAGVGSEERDQAGFARVESVQVLQPGDPELDQYRDAEGKLYFYDLEVARHPSFSVNGILVHNSAVLRSFGSKTFQTFLTLFESVPYRFVATATPSPNRYKELIHYAGFLGVLDTGAALTRFFQRDSEHANNLTLYAHKEEEFWLWLNSWAIFLQRPSDLGFPDDGYALPPLTVEWHEVPSELTSSVVERDGQLRLVRDATLGVSDQAREKRDCLPARIEKLRELLVMDPAAHAVLWHDLEDERRAIEKAVPGVKTVYGSQAEEEQEKVLRGFAEGEIQYIGAKPVQFGAGVNWQRHCHRAVFLGVGFKFYDFIQACHRIFRFLQTGPVRIDIIYSEGERAVVQALKEKWQAHVELTERMSEIIRAHGLNRLSGSELLARSLAGEREEERGNGWLLARNDCVPETQAMEPDSIDLIVTSIPFSNHYEYTPYYNDFGHTDGDGHFFRQMDFLTPELLRVLKPGRVAAVHVKDRILFGNVTGYGRPTVNPFHARTIFHYQEHGFAYLGMITVVTDVVRENNQTYRLGWSEQCKDGSKMGVGSPEYVLLFCKLPTDRGQGYADEPVRKDKADYTRARWQTDAHAFWRSSGDRLPTAEELAELGPKELASLYTRYSLSRPYDYEEHVRLGEALEAKRCLPATFMALAPGSHDPDVWTDVTRMRTLNGEQAARGWEQHVCPLQYDIVDRLIVRYSNSGELIFDPFCGLGTVPLRAVKLGRRGRGVELNRDYWRDSVWHLRRADGAETQLSLASLLEVA